GLPVPAAAGMIGSLVLMISAVDDLQNWVYSLPPLMLLIAFLMVSTIRYPSFKQVGWHTRARFGTFVVFLVVAAVIFFFRQYALVLLFLAYLSFGIARHLLMIQRRRRRWQRLVKERRERG